MIRWEGEAVVLSVRRHGETSALIDVFAADAGRYGGVVRGGSGRRLRAALQPGAVVQANWQARLDQHLGSLSLEPRRQHLGGVLDDPAALAALSSACALLLRALPERQPQPNLYAHSLSLMGALSAPGWAPSYVMWEMELLAALGFGLDLHCCAVTGVREGLRYVSPRTGRAVSATAALGWEAKLLPLPGILGGDMAQDSATDIHQALNLTGYFIKRHLFDGSAGAQTPEARERLARLFAPKAE